MKTAFKWLAVAIAGVFGVLLAIGLLVPDKPVSDQQPPVGNAQPASKVAQPLPPVAAAPMVNYAPDQCLDGICIGMTAGELVAKAWRKKDVVSEGDINSQQRELMELDQKGHADLCISRQTAWGKKTQEMCNLLSRGTSNPRSYGYRGYQVPAVLEFFANQTFPVCEFYEKERAYVTGHVSTDTGNTSVQFQFDATGILRVFEINKPFSDQNAETNASIGSKLMEKHPYAVNPTLNAFGSPAGPGDTTGDASWGGTVRIKQTANQAPMIWMTAKAADSDQTNLAVCKQAKPVSVQ